MSIYFIFLVMLLIIVFFSGILIYQRYKKQSGVYFLILSLAIIIWYSLYFLGFNPEYGSDLILKFYRFQYSLSIIGFYSLLFFILFFGIPKKKVQVFSYYIYAIFSFIFLIINFTPFLVRDVIFTQTNYYVEVFGFLYIVFIALYLLIIPLFLIISYYKLKTLSYLDRTRVFYIIVGFLIYLSISLIFIVFIPYLLNDPSALLFEKIVPFFIIPFIFSVIYSSYKYDFSDAKIYINSLFIYGSSLALSLTWIYIIHFLLTYLGEEFYIFWNIDTALGWLDIILGIIIFSGFLKIFQRFKVSNELGIKLRSIQDNLPFITDQNHFNTFLKHEFKTKIHISDVRIEENMDNYKNICNFFLQNPSKKFIVNDVVFLEQNKHKIILMQSDVSPGDTLIFPIYKSQNEIKALLFVGKKIIKDSYTKQENNELLKFSGFLGAYYKYISVYRKVQDLSMSLDKMVDEKTIEFNNLLNKQKEFIAYVGHEIKNPITNTLFLSDSIKDDIKGQVDSEIHNDAQTLYQELVKVSKLVKYIFSAEKFDLNKVKLYKDEINLSEFLESEVYQFTRNYKSTVFLTEIQQNIFLQIDEIQFRQVIQNLINNSLKFIDKDNGEIHISLKQVKSTVTIIIEDNGKGIVNGDYTTLFDKYSTGISSVAGLGMGLYLCKKIIKLHSGSISANPSKKLGGAKFEIKL